MRPVARYVLDTRVEYAPAGALVQAAPCQAGTEGPSRYGSGDTTIWIFFLNLTGAPSRRAG
jgi:hypothetical protein